MLSWSRGWRPGSVLLREAEAVLARVWRSLPGLANLRRKFHRLEQFVVVLFTHHHYLPHVSPAKTWEVQGRAEFNCPDERTSQRRRNE